MCPKRKNKRRGSALGAGERRKADVAGPKEQLGINHPECQLAIEGMGEGDKTSGAVLGKRRQQGVIYFRTRREEVSGCDEWRKNVRVLSAKPRKM